MHSRAPGFRRGALAGCGWGFSSSSTSARAAAADCRIALATNEGTSNLARGLAAATFLTAATMGATGISNLPWGSRVVTEMVGTFLLVVEGVDGFLAAAAAAVVEDLLVAVLTVEAAGAGTTLDSAEPDAVAAGFGTVAATFFVAAAASCDPTDGFLVATAVETAGFTVFSATVGGFADGTVAAGAVLVGAVVATVGVTVPAVLVVVFIGFLAAGGMVGFFALAVCLV